ncbi:hypothetical protein ALT_7489 [Aspergillus lentulus]|uniref:FAD dependent oxidoreductase domain-containing protein n=1 Tax=Aspergillus lentulus TaxID=293939 RepID=A0AAN4PNR0_ASPLE|nr:hypothetical protein ALT_7489 [Aspergillus lentulus]
MADNGTVTLRASRQMITREGRAIDFEYPRIQLSTNDEPKEKPNKDSKHILILGGGVSALTVTWILLDSGYRVILVAEQWVWTEDFLHQFFFELIEPKRDTGRDPNANDSHAIKLQGIEEAVDDHRIHGYKSYRTKEDFGREFKDFSFSCDYRGGFKCGYTHDAPIINTDKAMAYLMALVICKGANFEARKIKGNLRDQGKGILEIFDANAVLNATGPAARDLLGDEDVYPVCGAILRVDNTRNGQFNHLNDAYLVPEQKDNNGAPTGVVFLVPWNDDVPYVGSIIQPHNDQANLESGSPEVRVVWDRAAEFMPNFRHAEFVHYYPFAQGLRPYTKKNVKLLEEDYGEADEKWNQKAEKINEKIYGKED